MVDGPLSGCKEVSDRRAAVADLAAELRTLADLVTRTEVPVSVLRESARRLRELAPALRERTRGVAELASVDDLMGRVRMFNPVTGAGNPIAPPMPIESGENGDEGALMVGLCCVSETLPNQVFAQAAAAAGHPGVTTDLTVRYRRPVPLDVPLRVWGRVAEAGGRRQVSVVGGITTADKPDVQLVEADARFYRLRPDQVRRMFGRLASPGAASPEVAHD